MDIYAVRAETSLIANGLSIYHVDMQRYQFNS